jgi:hypothetical protein
MGRQPTEPLLPPEWRRSPEWFLQLNGSYPESVRPV